MKENNVTGLASSISTRAQKSADFDLNSTELSSIITYKRINSSVCTLATNCRSMYKYDK